MAERKSAGLQNLPRAGEQAKTGKDPAARHPDVQRDSHEPFILEKPRALRNQPEQYCSTGEAASSRRQGKFVR